MGAPSPSRGAGIAALLATLAVVAAVAGCGGSHTSVAQANPRATGAPAPGPFRIDAAEIAHRLGRAGIHVRRRPGAPGPGVPEPGARRSIRWETSDGTVADLFFFDDPATAMRARASLGGPSAVLLRLNAVAVVRHRANDAPRFAQAFLSTGDAVMGG
jgi:hypothetical protein